MTLTDKAIHVYSLGRQRNRDAIEMVRIARGITDDQLEREPSICTIINTNSPLTLDVPMSHGIIEMSSRNQIVCVTPFTLAGAMAPITLAGALAQQNAEALVGLMLTQLVRPGSPFIYGAFTSNVDMQSGAPAFGTPEYWKTAIVGGQLARRYGVPYRSSNTCAANAVDAQAAYESMYSIWGAISGGVNFMMHGAGWMEGGLHASFEKMVIDADLLHMASAALDPLVVDDDTLAFDAIAEVGPGGHFFGTGHTQARFRSEFYRPMISDWRNYETWAEAGQPRRRRQGQSAREGVPGGVRGARTIDDGHPRRTDRIRRPPHRRRRRPRRLLMCRRPMDDSHAPNSVAGNMPSGIILSATESGSAICGRKQHTERHIDCHRIGRTRS